MRYDAKVYFSNQIKMVFLEIFRNLYVILFRVENKE